VGSELCISDRPGGAPKTVEMAPGLKMAMGWGCLRSGWG
jgi:hypothetical protein